MHAKVKPAEIDDYLREATSWETDKTLELKKSERRAWAVATGAGLIALTALIALVLLMPLKTVEPYVIRVDNSTGIVDTVKSLQDGKTNYDEAINKYFTQSYVRHREGYSRELAEDYYYQVGIMSAGSEQQKYFEFFNPKNPMSPLNTMGSSAKAKVQIKSTSFIKPNIALVRYTKEVDRGMNHPQLSHWAATITFHYSGAPMSEKDRSLNPLGFQVAEYRNDPDALTPEPQATEKMPQPTASSGPTVFPAPIKPIVPALQPAR